MLTLTRISYAVNYKAAMKNPARRCAVLRDLDPLDRADSPAIPDQSDIRADAGMPVAVIPLIGVTSLVVRPIPVFAPCNMQLIIRAGIACSAVGNDRCSIQPPRIGIVKAIIVVTMAVAAIPEALTVFAAFIAPRSAFLTICTPVSPAFRPSCTLFAVSTALFSVCTSFRTPFGASFSTPLRASFRTPLRTFCTPFGPIGLFSCPAFSALCTLFFSRCAAIFKLDNRLLKIPPGFCRRHGTKRACRQRQSGCQPSQKLELFHWEPPFLATAALQAAN